MSDLFHAGIATPSDYTANDIEVLEGLEPVRRRPGMYIGGTDDRALHHLVAEVLDNSMDEAVAGHASRIELTMQEDGSIMVRDNGRGIPVDPHPKFPDKSALEVILTTLHSGGKFAGKAYATSGGLHGVGISVVNALSDRMMVEVARDRQLYRQHYSRGLAQGPIETIGAVNNRRGTTVVFHPDAEIFGTEARFRPERLYRMARSKAYLHRGVEIRWSCPASMITGENETPTEETLHFPGGLLDFLTGDLGNRTMLTPNTFAGDAPLAEDQGRVEWAIAWPEDTDGFCHSYCNTIPTPQGGSHEMGLRTALTRSLKGYGELINNKRAAIITADDVINGACIVLSLFIREPQFQGQTKEKLSTPAATRLVDMALKDRFDLWLSADNAASKQLLDVLIDRAEERQRARMAKDTARKTATKRLRLPGKLTDCSRQGATGTEIFLVEGDSAGGSAKMARRRETQAVLPLRGKILNVASASSDKLRGNQELSDLALALGTGLGKDFDIDALRYERVVIMTDADVDGAHIGSLLMTFFFEQMPGLIEKGRLFLAMPPLYRLTQGNKSLYARDDAHKEDLIKTVMNGRGKVEISRFKGLGEMPAAQLRETTMDPDKRTLIRVSLREQNSELAPQIKGRNGAAVDLVNRLMGRNPELRFQFIQERAKFAENVDI
jgi:topoisomerase-4 subunit B